MMQFYAKREAFNLELQLYLDPTLHQLMPARAEVIANQDRSNRSPNGFVFPPCIVLERGESLDEFAKNVDYEFITVMQVLLYSHTFAMSCEIWALLLRLAFNRISRSMYRSVDLPMAAVQLCMATEVKVVVRHNYHTLWMQALTVVASKLAQMHNSGWVHQDLSTLLPGWSNCADTFSGACALVLKTFDKTVNCPKSYLNRAPTHQLC